MTSQISFHPVVCSPAIYLLRNSWCQFQILNSLRWMNLPDEMLFLSPTSCLPVFSVNTAYYHLGRQSTGTGETAGKDSYVVGAASDGKWYEAKEGIWSVPPQSGEINRCLLTNCKSPFWAHWRGLGVGRKGARIWEALFSHPFSAMVISIRGKMISHLWYHTTQSLWQQIQQILRTSPAISLWAHETFSKGRLNGSVGLDLGCAGVYALIWTTSLTCCLSLAGKAVQDLSRAQVRCNG